MVLLIMDRLARKPCALHRSSDQFTSIAVRKKKSAPSTAVMGTLALVSSCCVLVCAMMPRADAMASASAAPPSSSSSSSQDLCFLSHGGSSETFTVNEALAPNSVVGTLKVIGNVSSGDGTLGDIELSLAPNHPKSRLEGQPMPVRIDPGTKNLILVRSLDKEGPEGENGVVVGVKCRRLNQINEPSIIIPVRLIVTDANDHAPAFIGTPYSANVSEVSVVGTPLLPPGTIRALDEDQQGPFSAVEYYIEPGPFSHMAKFESQFGGNLILTAPLDYETLPKFWIVVRAQDQGEPANSASATVTISVIDADDQNPRFLDDKYTATVPELNRAGEQLSVSPRAIGASDPDTGINSPIEFSFSSPSDAREYSFFSIDPKFGDIRLKKSLPPSVDLPLTLVVRATQVDNRDRYALTTLTVFNRRHLLLPDIRFLQSNYSATLLENIPAGQVALTVHASRAEEKLISGQGAASSIAFQILDDDEQHFAVRPSGEVILRKPLDYEKRRWYSFRVMVSDGKQSDVARVNVTILNVNDHDPLFSQNHYNFFVSEGRLKSNSVVGEIKASDADVGDTVSMSIKGPFAKVFSMNDDGLLQVKSLKGLNTSQCHLIVVATDSGSPPRSTSVPVTVQFAAGILKSFGRSLDEADGTPGRDVDVNMLLSASSSSAIVLVIVLGVLLATLFIIIITLTVHVLKQRKFPGSGASTSSDESGSGSASPNHYQQYYQGGTSRRSSGLSSLGKTHRGGPVPDGGSSTFNPPIVPGLGTRGVENPIFNLGSGTSTTSNLSSRYYQTPLGTSAPGLRSGGSDPDSAIVSDASSSNETYTRAAGNEGGDHRPGSRHSSHGSVSPPPPPSVTCTGSAGPTGAGTVSRISVVKWPQGSIPRRVKKLTWEDEIPGTRNNASSTFCQSQGQMLGTSHQLGAPGSTFFTSVSVRGATSSNTSTGGATTTCGLGSVGPDTTGLPQIGASSPVPHHTELDPDVSVAPLRRTMHHQNSSSSGLPDLTVYF